MKVERPHGLPLWVFALIGLAVGIGGGALVFFQPQIFPDQSRVVTQPTRNPAPAAVAGAPAPDFRLQSLDGTEVRLADLRGRVVLINFWATWCGPCKAEMPLFEDRYTTYRESGLEILAVNVGETTDVIRPFVDELGLGFPILLDPDLQVHDLYRVLGYPTTLTVDREGIVADVHVGSWLDEQLDAVLRDHGFGG